MDAQDGEETLALGHRPEKPLGQAEGQLRRRSLVPALLRQQRLRLRRHRQPGAASRDRQANPSDRAARAPNLYADSLVKLDPKTGKLLWYYQETPHNIYDWDFQNSPIITKAGGKEVAIGSGKSGFVVAVDVKTGKPVWRTSVGKHNGHDNDDIYAMKGEYSKIKPGEVFPGALGGVDRAWRRLTANGSTCRSSTTR